MINLQNKSILVTGSSKGIGKEMCALFAGLGASVISHVRTETREHKEFINSLPSSKAQEHRIFECELNDIQRLKTELVKLAKNNEIDGIVNNAGITHNAILAMTKIEDLKDQFEINTVSAFQIIQILSKKMIRRKHGSILNIVSTAAFDGNSGKTAYGASKAALVAMTETMSRELGPHNVRVNALAPGVTQTSMLSSMSEGIIDEAVQNSDMRRAAEPSDIAKVAAFLISDSSSYITGETVRVDGGMF